MATFSEQLLQTILKIGADIKNLRDTRGVMSQLTTTDKSSLVKALNEVKESIGGINPSDLIDDSLTSSTTKTYSVSKINDSIKKAIDALVADAPTALDTLKELADAISENETDLGAVLTGLDTRVAYTPQEKSAEQMGIARKNIDARQSGDVPDEEVVLTKDHNNIGTKAGDPQSMYNANNNEIIGEIGDRSIDFLSQYNLAAGN